MPAPKFATPVIWDTTNTYVTNEVVFYQGKNYTALKNVPANTAITNSEYWAETGLSQIKDDVSELQTDVDQNSSDIENVLITLYTPPATTNS